MVRRKPRQLSRADDTSTPVDNNPTPPRYPHSTLPDHSRAFNIIRQWHPSHMSNISIFDALAQRARIARVSVKEKRDRDALIQGELSALEDDLAQLSLGDARAALKTVREEVAARVKKETGKQTKPAKPRFTFARNRSVKVLYRRQNRQLGNHPDAKVVCKRQQGALKKVKGGGAAKAVAKRPSLLRLPPELRNIIYDYCMTDLPHFVLRPTMQLSQLVLYPKTLPPICFTAKHIRSETILAYLRRTRFIITETNTDLVGGIYGFLSQFPQDEAFNAIRQLSFSRAIRSYSFEGSGWPQKLVAKCPGLTSLVLVFAAEDMVKYPSGPFFRAPTIYSLVSVRDLAATGSTNRFVGIPGLSALFDDTPSLRSLKAYCVGGDIYVRGGMIWDGPKPSKVEDLFENLKTLLDGFAKRKTGVQVDFIMRPKERRWSSIFPP
ncbi:hypothetical protein P154DRAFT_531843 [Amniculicola lignicola CBS 123094]|uniref:Uncharacterized protein n=1 Tax=Amniculicola lignicola CBS 123094 TaxID=1392246 RepID=A0A6A5WT98_9PLEO|nr:hypothetical protein P154DRAFT_531843 [Amniculicola lignicola CBS 123094]